MSNNRSIKMIRRLGKPPIMAGEDPADYDQLAELVVAENNPQSVQAWVQVRDIVDGEWEILRLRNLKVAMLHAVIPRTVQSQISDATDLLPLEFKLAPLIRKHLVAIAAGDKSAKQELENLLAEHELTLDVMIAAAFESTIKSQVHTDHMVKAACDRRNAAYAKLERLHTKKAKKLATAQPEDLPFDAEDAPPTAPANTPTCQNE
jgi:hypothetical protein